jgi:hypothetical protein
MLDEDEDQHGPFDFPNDDDIPFSDCCLVGSTI